MFRSNSGPFGETTLPHQHLAHQQIVLQKQSVGEILDFWSEIHPDHPAMTFLHDGVETTTRSYGELREEAVRIAARLQEVCGAGDRVILLFPPGTDFVAAFLGCLYAGVLAVPATEPKPRRLNDRLSVVAADCKPAAVLCSAEVADRIEVAVVCPPLAQLPWLRVEAAGSSSPAAVSSAADSGEPTAPAGLQPAAADALAFLQYTSGSTRRPKGVAISHGNLLHNLEMIRLGFRQPFNFDSDPSLRGVFWLPPYHDMGLIGGILTPLYLGGTTVLMSPVSFLKRPRRWLETISSQRALISGAPNFAYDLCVDQIDAEEDAGLDLSCWDIAFCGAEPIRAGTIDRFAERFEPCGFRRDSFYPCYGLAEATLLVSGNLRRREPVIKRLDRKAMEQHRVQPATSEASAETFRVVGCGQPMLDGEIVIVDPETCRACPPEEIGEIWYRGKNVASHGYWNQPAESEAVFAATLAGDEETSYLRTGDMGFLADGQLFVTGRLKEMLVIRGRNLYPQDLEATAQESDEAFAEAGAAFSIELAGGEQLVLVQELDRRSRRADADALLGRLRAALAETHDIRPAAVVLVRPFSLPRTTSGKMQRLLCRQMYLRDQLNVVARWEATAAGEAPARQSKPSGAATGAPGPAGLPAASADAPASNPQGFGAPPSDLAEGPPNHVVEELEQWLCQRVAVYGNVAAEEVTPDQPLAELGLDSLSAVRLVAEIEDRQQITLNPIAMWNYPTARHLARYLAAQSVGDFAPGVPSSAEPDGGGFADLLSDVEALNDAQVHQRLSEIRSRPGPARYTPRRSVR